MTKKGVFCKKMGYVVEDMTASLKKIKKKDTPRPYKTCLFMSMYIQETFLLMENPINTVFILCSDAVGIREENTKQRITCFKNLLSNTMIRNNKKKYITKSITTTNTTQPSSQKCLSNFLPP